MAPQVTIEQGTLQGTTSTDVRGNLFFKFQGIPYATPPLGDLRFKAPQPPQKWSGVLDATKEGDCCYAREPLKQWRIFGSENCLFLNVYTKKLPDEKHELSPVLFWIHGGGFFFGSGNEDVYGPGFLLTQDVVLVTINYRLGLLGFISFEDPALEISGNMGLKDQVMALKWVQKNIQNFGGDPNNVTIFGESAGGASVHLLTLSPMGKGLFHKAIAQSGCALNPWVAGTRGAHLVAEALNLQGSDDKTIYDALMKKPVEEIFKIQEEMSKIVVGDRRRPLGLVVEQNSKEPFLDEEPLKIIESGRFNQVPLIMGYTSAEGLVAKLLNSQGSSSEGLVPWFFGYKNGTEEIQAVIDKIQKFYFANCPENLLEDKTTQLLGDVYFVFGILTSVLTQCKVSKSPIYLYRMTAETELNFLKRLLKIDSPGVSHMDDVGHLFKNFATPEFQEGSKENQAMSRFVKLWTNFAKFGNPTPDGLLKVVWKAVTGPNLDLLEIGEELGATQSPDSSRISFWKSLYEESPGGLAK